LIHYKPKDEVALKALLDQGLDATSKTRIVHLDLSETRCLKNETAAQIGKLEYLESMTFGHETPPNHHSFQMFIEIVPTSTEKAREAIENALLERQSTHRARYKSSHLN